MIQTCSKCKNYDISICDEPCRKCQQAFRRGEGKPNFIASITNADRIRSMTDEELAELLTAVAQKSAHKLCESLKTVEVDLSNCNFHILYEAHLGWLKEEVTANDS